jgi:hypothetical protein
MIVVSSDTASEAWGLTLQPSTCDQGETTFCWPEGCVDLGSDLWADVVPLEVKEPRKEVP